MQTLLEYNTRMSFGAGAHHLEVIADKGKIKIYAGTPQRPEYLGYVVDTPNVRELIDTASGRGDDTYHYFKSEILIYLSIKK